IALFPPLVTSGPIPITSVPCVTLAIVSTFHKGRATHTARFVFTEPCPTHPCPTMPHHAKSGPTMPRPTEPDLTNPRHTLPRQHLAMPNQTQPGLTSPCLTRPNPTGPYRARARLTRPCPIALHPCRSIPFKRSAV